MTTSSENWSRLKIIKCASKAAIDWIGLALVRVLDSNDQNDYPQQSFARMNLVSGAPKAMSAYSLVVTPRNKETADSRWKCSIEYIVLHRACGEPFQEIRVSDFSDSQKSVEICQCRCEGTLSIAYAIRSMHDGREAHFPSLSGDERFWDPDLARDFKANCKIDFGDGDKPMLVNRQLLAFYCKYFEAMFEGEFKEKNAEEISLPGVVRADLFAFMRCLYLPAQPITHENIRAVFPLADQFECRVLLGECEKFFQDNMPRNVEEFKEYIEFSDRLHFTNLLKKLMQDAPPEILGAFLDPEWIEKLDTSTVKTIHQEAFSRFTKR